MQTFMITITAKAARSLTAQESDYYDKDSSIRDVADMTVKTRVVHMGFIIASTKEEAQKRVANMCRELEMGRDLGNPPRFSAETYHSEYDYHAEVAGEGDLIRVGEFDD